jgi:predicted kinase
MKAPLDWRTDPFGNAVPSWAILVAGAPGSGKSTIGIVLARQLRAALLDLDTATAGLTAIIGELRGTHDLDDPKFAGITRAARYEAITSLAEENLATGIDVVMVAPFSAERRDPQSWNALHRRLADAGAATTLVWLRISAEEVVRRIEKRDAGRDLSKRRGDWTAGLDLDPPVVPHLEVDALLSPEIIAETVLLSLSLDTSSRHH